MADGKKDYGAITGAISEGISGLRGTGAKETLTQFNAMAKAALADGALDTKTKELIALAIGVPLGTSLAFSRLPSSAMDVSAFTPRRSRGWARRMRKWPRRSA